MKIEFVISLDEETKEFINLKLKEYLGFKKNVEKSKPIKPDKPSLVEVVETRTTKAESPVKETSETDMFGFAKNVEKPEVEKVEEPKKPSPVIDAMIRSLVVEKRKTKMAEIKALLTEFKALTVSDIKPDDYERFYKKLKDL